MRRRLLMCSLDGVRPDALAQATTPTIDALIANGAYNPTARSVMPSVTLPCHTSMLRGVDVPRHGITTNTFMPLARPVPSLLDVAATQGRRCGFFYNWEPLRDLAAPGSLAAGFFVADGFSPEGDREVARLAVEQSARQDIDTLFVYFGHPDEVGHKHGWMSQPYIDAISNADTCLGIVIDAIKAAGHWENTVTLVLSDHGGHDRGHGTDSPEDMTIPWLLHGPGIKQGVTLTEEIRLFDTPSTLAHLLELTPHHYWEGRVVTEALV